LFSDNKKIIWGVIMAIYKSVMPQIDSTAFIAPSADVIGDVVIGAEASVWFGCVLRGDVNKIRIGARTNIQDGTVIHVTRGTADGNMGIGAGQGTLIGEGVTVGHMALLHDCTIADNAFVGMKACVMDKAVIEEGAMLAAGGLLTPGKVIRSGELWGGAPAKYMRDLTEEEKAFLPVSAQNYVDLSRDYL